MKRCPLLPSNQCSYLGYVVALNPDWYPILLSDRHYPVTDVEICLSSRGRVGENAGDNDMLSIDPEFNPDSAELIAV